MGPVDDLAKAAAATGGFSPSGDHDALPVEELKLSRRVFATNSALQLALSGRFANDPDFKRLVMNDLEQKGSRSIYARYFEMDGNLFRGRPSAEQLALIEERGAEMLAAKAQVSAVFADHASVLLGEKSRITLEGTDAIRKLPARVVVAIGTGDFSLADYPVFEMFGSGDGTESFVSRAFRGTGPGQAWTDSQVAQWSLRTGLRSNAEAWSAVRNRIDQSTNLFAMMPSFAMTDAILGTSDVLSSLRVEGADALRGELANSYGTRRFIETATARIVRGWTATFNRFARRIPGAAQIASVATRGFVGELAVGGAMMATGMFQSATGELKNGSNHGVDITGVTADGTFVPVEVKTSMRNAWVRLSERQNLGGTYFARDVLERARLGHWPSSQEGMDLRDNYRRYFAGAVSPDSGIVVQINRFGRPDVRVSAYEWVNNLNALPVRSRSR
jgi:hypothetical protein